jgi:integrase/recombinase XerD
MTPKEQLVTDLLVQNTERRLTASEFQNLAEAPPEAEWFANIENANTRRAYRNDVHDFMAFTGIQRLHEFRLVKRSHLGDFLAV